ncbi:hypothetical protein [Methylorubrum extorquens]|nr:hypothetical protein [Methylorubrum extorquens]MCP1535477.1 hypothetical protein [Methylorubrum extorquens]
MRTIIEIDNGNAAAISGGGKDLADLLVRALMTGSNASWISCDPSGSSAS